MLYICGVLVLPTVHKYSIGYIIIHYIVYAIYIYTYIYVMRYNERYNIITYNDITL